MLRGLTYLAISEIDVVKLEFYAYALCMSRLSKSSISPLSTNSNGDSSLNISLASEFS